MVRDARALPALLTMRAERVKISLCRVNRAIQQRRTPWSGTGGVADAERKRVATRGGRGLGFNVAQAGATTAEMIEPLSKRVNELGWHIQINASAAIIMSIMDILNRVPSGIVFDHLAHVPEPAGIGDPLFARVRALIDKGKTWIKLSDAYQDTKDSPPSYTHSRAQARAHVKPAPE